MPVTSWDLAVIVPVSFVVQMLPVSVNGFGVREATFSLYFTRLGLPIQSAVLLSLMATGADDAVLADRRRRLRLARTVAQATSPAGPTCAVLYAIHCQAQS